MKVLNSIALAILIIGAINWGSIGLFNVDLIATIFGGVTSMMSKLIYMIVGICGIWAFTFFNRIDDDKD